MSQSILIADKDKNNRNYIKQIINSVHNFEIKEVDEARDFIQIAVNETPCLIIMDINIHQQSYEKILEIVRSAHSKEELPIVVISYAIEKEKIFALFKLGIEDFILKPFINNSAAEKIKVVLKKLIDKESYKVAETTEKSNGKEKILLVDHDHIFRNQFLRLYCEKYEIITADNGEEGLLYFEKYKPGFVFISEHLKIINERMLVQKIRSIGNGETKIYFLSTILKSSAMKSSLFNGVIEKSNSAAVFQKEFAKIVLGEEINLYQKLIKFIRNTLHGQLENLIKQSLGNTLKEDITIFNPKEDFKISNELLATVELIDEKKEFSVTIGLYGSSKDILGIAERIIGVPVTFNSQASEAIGGAVSEFSSLINHQISLSGIKLTERAAKVNSILENKLSYDWDLELYGKNSKNLRFAIGVYCSKYI